MYLYREVAVAAFHFELVAIQVEILRFVPVKFVLPVMNWTEQLQWKL